MHQAFEGLAFIGKLTDTFTWMGHRIIIRTLVADELLEVGLLAKRYMGSLGEAKAYQMACVGACIVTADGQPLPLPMTNGDLAELVEFRFNWVKANWHSIVHDAIYEKFLLLDDEAHRIVEAMGEASGQTAR